MFYVLNNSRHFRFRFQKKKKKSSLSTSELCNTFNICFVNKCVLWVYVMKL